jgi:hypothetical protein
MSRASAKAINARRNVPTLTRREANGTQESTQQSRRSLDNEGFRCHPAFSEDRSRVNRLLRNLDARWSPSIRRRVSRVFRCRRARRFGDRAQPRRQQPSRDRRSVVPTNVRRIPGSSYRVCFLAAHEVGWRLQTTNQGAKAEFLRGPRSTYCASRSDTDRGRGVYKNVAA